MSFSGEKQRSTAATTNTSAKAKTDIMDVMDPRSREERVKSAIAAEDWNELEALSLLPGGFQDARIDAWLFLLGVNVQKVQQAQKKNELATGLRQSKHSRPNDSSKLSEDEGAKDTSIAQLDPHKDERQVGLDTERSFVVYSIDDEKRGSKDDLKAQLHHVIVHILRKRPKLSYFQGYHDILSVLLLTFIEHSELDENGEMDEDTVQLLTAAAEKLSLHRLRDSMGPGLEPLLGLLRLLKQLLRAVDPEYSKQLSSSSPLPFYALSNILTYFSHDVPTLALVQHIFDYLFARPPVIIVYLTTVMLLARKEEVQTLFETDDEGMLHALLCTLPELTDEAEKEEEETEILQQSYHSTSPNPTAATATVTATAASRVSTLESAPGTGSKSDSSGVLVKSQDLSESWIHTSPTLSERERERERSPSETPSLIDDMSTSQSFTAIDSSRHSMASITSDSIPSPGTSPTLASIILKPEPDVLDLNSSLEFPPLPPASPTSSTHDPIIISSTSKIGKPSALSLPSLLKQADELYKKHPPSTLNASQIMGPQSVIFTLSDNPSSGKGGEGKGRGRRNEISDDMAEKMVLRPELVVKSYRDEDEIKADEEAELAREDMRRRKEAKEAPRKRAKSRRTGKDGAGILTANGTTTIIVVGGAVVVVALGVAIAVYGRNGEWRKWAGKAPWIGKGSFIDQS